MTEEIEHEVLEEDGSSEGTTAPKPVDYVEEATYQLRALEALLRRARNAWRNPLMVEGALWIGATALAVVASALLFGFLFPKWRHPGADIILLAGGAATLVGALVVAIPFWLRVPNLEQVAAQLQRYNAQLRSDVVAALQYAYDLRDGVESGFSRALALEHIKRTAKALNELDKAEGGMAASLPSRPLQAPALAFAAALAVVMIPWVVANEDFRDILALELVMPDSSEEAEEQNRPVVGDLDLYFSYPTYAEMTGQFQAFTTGNIETLIGTEVTIKTFPLLTGAAKFEVVMTLDGDERRRELTKDEAGRLEATILITKPGVYHFEATMPDGTRVSDGIDRRITVLPDKAPEVAITSHEQAIEVSPEDILTFEFNVSDDFGIESVGFVHHFAGQEKEAKKVPVEMPELSNTPDAVEGSFELDLAPLGLQPKDVVVLRLEATDNNSLTGPGIGSSGEYLLRVASPEDKHMQVIQAEQAVLEALLLVLADYLEAPAGERVPNADNVYRQKVEDGLGPVEYETRFIAVREAHAGQNEVLEAMKEVVARMKDDPLMLPRDLAIFEALYEQLYELHRDGGEIFNRLGAAVAAKELSRRGLQEVADHAADTEDALEKGLLRLEDLLSTQKMAAIESAAEEVRELKERLKELLEKYRDTQDPELKKAILREIQRLRQRMAELMSRMQDDLKKLKQDHVNMEALEQQMMESDAAKLGENLQSIEEMLEKGDIDGALKALDDMTANLDSLTQEMDTQFGEAQPEGLNKLDQKLGELMDKVNDVEQAQRAVEQQTNELREKEQKERQAKMEETIDRLTRRAREMVDEQKRDLDKVDAENLPKYEKDGLERAKERLEKLEKMLEQRDLESASDAARGNVDDFRSLRFGMSTSRRYTKGDEKKALDDGLERLEKRMSPRSHRIVDEIEEAMKQAQNQMNQGSSEQLQQLQQKQQKVEEQAQKLRESIDEASQEFPMIGNQLRPPMDGAQKKMQEASGSLGEGKTQRALDQERGALDQLRQLKQSMKEALQKEQQGRQGKREKVEIPGQKGPSSDDFRDAVKKGMKGDRLEDYANEIERYYESLTE